ncbi:sodium:calcium antiporter [Natronolimnobius sp. AArcel1]|uniref:sodium:calcium antiporter n=1 Tax=Natronolimnobius sp. AArcel1 TaxID=1679093 RepID=UPI0013EBEEAA|nr:sodium:calcium antiporter [Natronolimnobius sp. AArcel1]
MLEVLALLVIATVATGVVWKGSTWLEAAANDLAAGYGVPAVVQGAVIAAVGSSMPELMSVIIATLRYGEFELGIGAIVGSAVFNLVGGRMDTNRDLVYKEALFYMLAVAVLLLTFSLAVIYSPLEGEPLEGTITRPLALVPLGLYALYLFVQYLDVSEHDGTRAEIPIARTWGWFAVGLVVIIVGVEGLVQAAIGLGDAFGTPAFLWGMTIVAAGSSVPDAFVSVAAAREGRSSVSLANVLGSNIFDLLVALPAGVLVAGSLAIAFPHVVPMMAFLILATVVFFAIARTDMLLSRTEAWTLLGLYGLFVVWLVLESLDVVTVLPT